MLIFESLRHFGGGQFDPLVMLIDSDGKALFRLFLTDDVFIQKALNLIGFGSGGRVQRTQLLIVSYDSLQMSIHSLQI